MSVAMAPTKLRRRGFDRGEVLVDLAVALADGATSISDLALLSDQPDLFGPVASVPTAWRTLAAMDQAALDRIAMARADARRRAWQQGADPGFYVIDIDATLVTAHSEKKGAAPTYKHGFGFHPVVSYLDATGESLAAKLRPGNEAPGKAADLVEVLDASLVQLPIDPRQAEVIVRADAAGCSHEFIDASQARGVRFCVGHALSKDWAKAVLEAPDRAWVCAITADGADERDGAWVTEITDRVDLSGWPAGTRAIARREEAHPGAQLSFSDVDGHRYQVFITDLAGDVVFCEALYRGRGRAECAIRDSKDTGLGQLPSADFDINVAWVVLVMMAGDLLAWTRRICLQGELARATPGRLRYTLLHTAGMIVRSARRTTLRIAQGWPWADQLVAAFTRLPNWSMVT